MSKPEKRTDADFEKNAAESALILGIGMSALQGLMDPTAAKAIGSKDADERRALPEKETPGKSK